MTICAVLTLASCGLFFCGGVFAALVVGQLMLRSIAFDPRNVVNALVSGAAGIGALFAVLRIAPRESEFFDRRRLLAFGLLFPGASQIYARRWALGVFFLFGSVAAFIAAVALVSFVGIVAPQRLSMLGESLELTIPAVFVVLWAASLTEAYFWAARQPADIDSAGWPRGKGVVAALNAIAFLLPGVQMSMIGILDVALRVRLALR